VGRFPSATSEEISRDITCDQWSKLDTLWQGVSIDTCSTDRDRGGLRHPVLRRGLHDQSAARGRHRRKAVGGFAYEVSRSAGARRPARMLGPHVYFWRARSGCAAAPAKRATSGSGDERVPHYGDPWREQRYWATDLADRGGRRRRHETPRVKTIAFDGPRLARTPRRAARDIRLTAEDGYQAQRSYSIARRRAAHASSSPSCASTTARSRLTWPTSSAGDQIELAVLRGYSSGAVAGWAAAARRRRIGHWRR